MAVPISMDLALGIGIGDITKDTLPYPLRAFSGITP
jgi:hypothetical protein